MNSKKDILIVSTQPFNSGAWAYYPIEILNALSTSNEYNIHFLCHIKDSSVNYHIPENVNKIPFKLPRQKILKFLYVLFPIAMLKKISKLNKKYKFQCIHFISPDFIFANIMRILQSKYKLLYTVHDLYYHPANGTQVSYILKYFLWNDKRNVSLCKNLVSCSNSQIKEMETLFPDKKIFFHHMPNHIHKFIKNGNDCIQELKGIKEYFLFFGRIEPYKGVEILYKAYLESGLENKIPLVIAGNTSDSNYNPFSEHKCSSNLFFINRFIEDFEIRNLFSLAKCVIYPYTSITMSAVIQFPYCFGVPVIASDLPYFRDEIRDGETGLLFKTGDYQDLLQKMRYVCDVQLDIEKMKKEQLKLYRQICSTDNLRKELEYIYSSIIQGGTDGYKPFVGGIEKCS
jgi:glycosyltransferase involved in cell wall biosynthesis